MIDFPYRVPAIKVEQPLGDFYVVALSAEFLLQTCYTIKAEILEDSDEDEGVSYLGSIVNKLKGNQRIRSTKRLKEIKNYTETVDASFPNSIILGANYFEDGTLVTDPELRWNIVETEIEDGRKLYELVVPTNTALASIIDGQHRVFGFTESNAKDMMLPCSVYTDLPLPYHARIFSNININQKRVDKNLAYNLFQFDMEQGEAKTWSPETLAVYFTRVLAKEEQSPFYGKIKLGLINSTSETSISMASVIDGILSLITNNPKLDREEMHKVPLKERERNLITTNIAHGPLRKLFIDNKDKTLFDIIQSYFNALKNTLWSYPVFQKTLGVHASFDFLRAIIASGVEINDLNQKYFESLLVQAKEVDFDDSFYGIQTKLRSRLRNTLLIACKLELLDNLKVNDQEKASYNKLLN